MKGSNELILNQQTMVAIVQHYFDTVLFKDGVSPVAASVATDDNRGSYGGSNFKVTVSERQPEPKPS